MLWLNWENWPVTVRAQRNWVRKTDGKERCKRGNRQTCRKCGKERTINGEEMKPRVSGDTEGERGTRKRKRRLKSKERMYN